MKVCPNYSTQLVLEFTYECVQRILGAQIPGCLIECGVAAGNQLGAMQECLEDNKTKRAIYGFDSFQGIPYAGKNDLTQPGIGEVDKTKYDLLQSTGVSSHPKGIVFANFKKWNLSVENLHLIEGWFQNTLPKYNGGDIALLRIDCDLYSSTKICLEYLLNKMSPNGFVIFDDWQLQGARKAILEFIPQKKIIECFGIAYCKI